MAFETEIGELSSRHIVDEIDRNLTARIENLTEQGLVEPPRLIILSDNPEHLPSQQYMGIKKKVAEKLGMTAIIETSDSTDVIGERITLHNESPDTHGVIVQLPLKESEKTVGLLSSIDGSKDVDGLGPNAEYHPATPLAIVSLLDGYGIEYMDEPVTIIGRGKLVGEPLYELLLNRGAQKLQSIDKNSPPDDVQTALDTSSVIISAVGKPDLLTPKSFSDISRPRVVIDAGTAEQAGTVKGDVSDALREVAMNHGWAITPPKGGIGPLTVRALLANTISAAENS